MAGRGGDLREDPAVAPQSALRLIGILAAEREGGRERGRGDLHAAGAAAELGYCDILPNGRNGIKRPPRLRDLPFWFSSSVPYVLPLIELPSEHRLAVFTIEATFPLSQFMTMIPKVGQPMF